MSDNDNDLDPLSEDELQKLSSDELIAYIRKATAAGRADDARSALAILCYRHYDDVVRRVRMRVPEAGRGPGDDRDARGDQVGLRRRLHGPVRQLAHRIVDRRGIADYHRKRETEPAVNPLPTEHAGEEDVWGEEPAEESESGRSSYGR